MTLKVEVRDLMFSRYQIRSNHLKSPTQSFLLSYKKFATQTSNKMKATILSIIAFACLALAAPIITPGKSMDGTIETR